MLTNIIQKWCYSDTEYKEAMELQRVHDELDPKHENLKRVVVIDCRDKG